MISVVCWWWKTPGYRSQFTADCVNVLHRMVERHFNHPHRFICVTNESREGLAVDIETVPLDTRWANVAQPGWSSVPGCFQRLQAFASDAADKFGPRFVSLDLDCVITGDVTPLWTRPEPFVIWQDPDPVHHVYNASMFLLESGARTQVFDQFDPKTSPLKARTPWEQGWIAYSLGPYQPMWTRADGVYSFKRDIKPNGGALPKDARMVFFHGQYDPWMPAVQADYPWIAEHWC